MHTGETNNYGGKKSLKSGIWYDFTQQQSKAWVPRYSSGSTSPLFIGVGVVLVPLGILVLLISNDSSTQIKEFHVDYTFCTNVKNESETCASYVRSPAIWDMEGLEVCQCDVEFELVKPMKGEKIYMYYRLENFHQNIRKYLKSRDDDQLVGKIGNANNPKEPSKDCEPYRKDPQGRIVFPCGAVANSMFNDSIQLYYNDDIQGDIAINQNRRGIAWSSDIKHRFKNPPQFSNPNDPIWQKFTKPRDWGRTIWELDPLNPENNGVQNEDLIVWMRPAAFSNFQKLYRIIESSSQDILYDGLPAGKYRLRINYTYEVTSFGGRKGITFSSPTVFGQQNFFQGIASISIGGMYVVAGLLLLLCGCSARHGKGSFTRRNYDMEL